MRFSYTYFRNFIRGAGHIVTHGSSRYFGWLALLLLLMLQGALAYAHQLHEGLIVTNMRDPASWGLYIGTFAFLVGVAAAAVMLVIPAYVYNWKPIREVVIFGELLAVASLVVCILFVTVDIGRPERVWHLFPLIGTLHFPSSLLAWDMLVLSLYLLLNLVIVTHLLVRQYNRKPYVAGFVRPLVIISIPAAIGIHTVTAFLFNGLGGRPFWNSAILAPRFIASALCSGPAILLVLFQVLRKVTNFRIRDEAIRKIAELMAYAMAVNLFFLGSEMFKELYTNSEHIIHLEYVLGYGRFPDSPVRFYAWISIVFALASFTLFVVPRLRKHPVLMNIGAVLIFISVFFEKGVALVVPGFTPDVLGQVYQYAPSLTEFRVSVGVLATGAFLYTLMVRIASAIVFDEITIDTYRQA